MKRIFLLVTLLFALLSGYSQSRYYIRADSVYIEKGGGNGELIIRNGTRDSTNGVMVNLGGGRTAFLKSKQLTDSSFVIGKDTIIIHGIGGGSHVTSYNWNPFTGILTTSQSGAADVTVNLDGRYVETLFRRNDSVFAIKDGIESFQFKDSTGGGGGINQLTGEITAGPGTGSQAATVAKVTGIPVSRTKPLITDDWYHGMVLTYDHPDSTLSPKLPNLFKVALPKGSGLKTFGHSLGSPSTDPPTRLMHTTKLARTIGGPDSNLAVGGTNMHAQLARINQEDHLKKGETQPLLLVEGIDNREDTSIYADYPVYHTAGIFAAVRSHRDTIVLPSGMTFSGSWSTWTEGLAAGARTNGRITSTSGDYYEFTATGSHLFFTWFSESPIDNPTNYTDSVTVSVDGAYFGSYSMANIGIQAGGEYLCIIFLHDLTNTSHTVRVTNRRNKPMAIDFAGAMDDPGKVAPMMFEFVSPVGDGYIGGSGVIKKKRINRLNKNYHTYITKELTIYGFPAICLDPLQGFNPNKHTKDWLHPDSLGQHLFYESIMKQIVITGSGGVTFDSVYAYGDIPVGAVAGGHLTRTDDLQFEPFEGMQINGNSTTGGLNSILVLTNNNSSRFNFHKDGSFDIFGQNFYKRSVTSVNMFINGGNKTNTASGNVSIGVEGSAVMPNITSGGNNIGIGGEPGNEAAKNITSGDQNILIGRAAGKEITTGNENTIIGSIAGINTTGSGNVMMGFFAGGENTSGNYNTFIGYNAGRDVAASNLTNVTILANDQSNNLTTSLSANNVFVYGLNQNILAGKLTDDGVGKMQVGGKVTISTMDSSAGPANMVWRDPVTKELKLAAVPSGADGNGIYGGPGSLPSDVTVTGGNHSLQFDDIFAFHINSDYNVFAKANGTGTHTAAVIGNGNIFQIGYTPVEAVFSKGAGLYIDTNNNVGIGTQPPTTMPLYATGSSTYLQGLQSAGGNFYRVSSISADQTLNATYYFVLIDASSNNVTVTLPAASTVFGSSMGVFYRFQRVDNSGNTVTIQRAGSDTINGANSFTLTTQYGIKYVQCTSTSTWAQGTD